LQAFHVHGGEAFGKMLLEELFVASESDEIVEVKNDIAELRVQLVFVEIPVDLLEVREQGIFLQLKIDEPFREPCVAQCFHSWRAI
jgi:hypothetical protein